MPETEYGLDSHEGLRMVVSTLRSLAMRSLDRNRWPSRRHKPTDVQDRTVRPPSRIELLEFNWLNEGPVLSFMMRPLAVSVAPNPSSLSRAFPVV